LFVAGESVTEPATTPVPVTCALGRNSPMNSVFVATPVNLERRRRDRARLTGPERGAAGAAR
jgi:hypothetical protein